MSIGNTNTNNLEDNIKNKMILPIINIVSPNLKYINIKSHLNNFKTTH